MSLGILRGLQDTRVPMIMAAVSYWGLGMPAAYALGFPLGFGVVGVWIGLVLGLAGAAALLFLRFWALAGRSARVAA
jgi:MATE family multidrug resistance protein